MTASVSTNQAALSALIGQPLRDIGRAADLLWLAFGAWREVQDVRGGTRKVGRWALHVQCDWHISRRNKPRLARSDIFPAPGDGPPGDTEDIVGNNRFDRTAAALSRDFDFEPPIVQSVTCDGRDGFSMTFTDGSELEVTPDCEICGESWRLFQPATDAPHHVVPAQDRSN